MKRFAVVLVLLCAGLSDCQSKTTPSEKCKSQRYPDLLQPKSCVSRNNTIHHGKTGDVGSRKCLGAYCWYGHLIPIECPFGKPTNNTEFTFVRRPGPWPKCCYWTRTCTNNSEYISHDRSYRGVFKS
uniref:8.9 kDa family member n=1 Tax=Rhipicephalus appendiculatus TaxID=34631 RepID=A0A131YSZ9_RHIAP